MPIYEYKCEACHLLFEKNVVRADREKPQPCPSCQGLETKPVLPSNVTSSINLEVKGITPQNTGIHDLDTHIDRVIGKSADQGREVMRQRHDAKKTLMKNNGVSGHDIVRTKNNEYAVIPTHKREVLDKARADYFESKKSSK